MYKVIVTKDDPMVASINRQYIEKNRLLKVTAQFSNGEETLCFLKNHDADFLVLDVYMPVMDGIELLRTLRKINKYIHIIMVTAANDMNQVKELLSLGVLDYLIKPFEAERFNLAIEKFLKRKKTLNKIIDYLKIQKNEPLTSEEIAEAVHLSRVTIRRYMNYLVETQHVISDIDYQTGG